MAAVFTYTFSVSAAFYRGKDEQLQQLPKAYRDQNATFSSITGKYFAGPCSRP